MSALRAPRRPRPRFMLTPLVDVMFLLLIFFMLSSQTAPYSLLTVSAPLGEAPATGSDAAPAPTTPTRDLLVSVSNGYVRFNGQRVDMREIGGVVARFKAQGFSTALVLTAPGARVQDIVSVLEAFEDAQFGATRLLMQGES